MCHRLRELQTTQRSVLWLIRISGQNLWSNFFFIRVGGPSCVGGGKTFTSVYYYINIGKSLSSATRPQIYAHLIELVELILNICMRMPESAHQRHRWRKTKYLLFLFFAISDASEHFQTPSCTYLESAQRVLSDEHKFVVGWCQRAIFLCLCSSILM